ncbi:MAG: hypothetical protein IT374_11505 [Polyangiaceae bacterium]|nr:hypothetical protein [Polyangiaceae bacterium]
MPLSLPKDALLALAAVGWSDGTLDPDEGRALLRTAKEAGLDAGELAEIEQATRAKLTIPEISTITLTRKDRVLCYALATWLARLDGVVTAEERASLVLLGDRLGLPDGVRTRASAAAFEVASQPAGDRPDRYDFAALEARILAKLGDLEAE